MKDINIEQAFKIKFMENIFIVPFSSEFKDSKVFIATKILEHLNKRLNKPIEINSVNLILFENNCGSVEKNLTIVNRNDRVSILGKGWASCNHEKNNVIVL